MADEKQVAQAAKLLKQGKNIKEIAQALGLTTAQTAPIVWEAEPVADESLKFKGTDANVKKAYAEGMRYDRIAFRTGLGLAAVKKIVAEAGLGRGPGRAASTNGVEPVAGKNRAKAKANTGPKATRSNKPAPAKPAAKARTRAERAAKAGSPS